jgi:hypothetical protein
MYCSGCGNQISPELNYCNRCGAKTGKEEGTVRRSGSPLAFLLAALCVIDIAALLIFGALIMFFLDKHVDGKVVATISTFYLASFAVINIFFMRLISRLVSLHLKEGGVPGNTKKTAVLSPAITAQLAEPWQQPVGSVTDHTTRTLDEVLAKER